MLCILLGSASEQNPTFSARVKALVQVMMNFLLDIVESRYNMDRLDRTIKRLF